MKKVIIICGMAFLMMHLGAADAPATPDAAAAANAAVVVKRMNDVTISAVNGAVNNALSTFTGSKKADADVATLSQALSDAFMTVNVADLQTAKDAADKEVADLTAQIQSAANDGKDAAALQDKQELAAYRLRALSDAFQIKNNFEIQAKVAQTYQDADAAKLQQAADQIKAKLDANEDAYKKLADQYVQVQKDIMQNTQERNDQMRQFYMLQKMIEMKNGETKSFTLSEESMAADDVLRAQQDQTWMATVGTIAGAL